MADPVISNVNIFQAQSDANHQQLLADAAIEREHERTDNKRAEMINATKERVEKNKKENEDLRRSDSIIKRAGEEPERRFLQDEKTEQRHEDEKKESLDRKIKTMDGDYLKELKKDLEQRRSVYASINLMDSAKLAEVRKNLNSKNVEESIAIRNSRDEYQKTLDRYKDAKIEELKSKGLSGDALKVEMSELIRQFGYMEILEMNNARNDAKAELNMGGHFVKKCWGYLEKTANIYNNLPMWQKLLYAGAGVAGGISLTTGAAATAGVAGAAGLLVGAKRVFGSVIAGVGTAKGLDTLHQAKMEKSVNKDVEKVIEGMDRMKPDDSTEDTIEKRYEAMRAALDIKLENVDENLKRHELISLCNKFIGVSVGVFLGSGYAAKAFGGAFKMVSEYISHGGNAAGDATKGITGSILRSTHINVPTIVEDLTIKEGSNFSKTLLKEFNNPNSDVYKYHPELKGSNPQELIKRVLMDFKDTHPEMEGNNPDYVLANAKIHFNPASLHAEMDEGKYGWYENNVKDAHNVTNHAPTAPIETLSTGSVDNIEAPVSAAPEVVTGLNDKVADLQNQVDALENHDNVVRGEVVERIIANEDKIVELDKAYEGAMDDVFHNTEGDSAWTRLIEKSGVIDRERTGLKKALENIFESDKSAADNLREMRKFIAGSNSATWKGMENLKVSEVVDGDNIDKLPKPGKNLVTIFQQDKATAFRPNETMKDWTRRVIVTTQRMMSQSK
ncbi:MAG: hypothetical protein HGA36_01970 [Candidatus Moranbacteria bacterium]|nr:hypothetical protein [Candidatus Moranbacteria bacterium]